MRPRLASLAAALALFGCIAPPPAATPEPKAAGAAPSAATPGKCSWPGGASAAVSLTYDDGLLSQIERAVPVLDAAGLHATFFLSGGHVAEFAPLAKRGHELASHTLKHPCNADLAALGAPEMASELDAGNAAVQALGVSGKLTFAYPCGQMSMKGMESYVPLVKERFRAARGVAGRAGHDVPAPPEVVDEGVALRVRLEAQERVPLAGRNDRLDLSEKRAVPVAQLRRELLALLAGEGLDFRREQRRRDEQREEDQ